MLYVWIGSISFLFFALSDLNEIRFQRRFLSFSFPIGCMMLAAATIQLIRTQPADLSLAAPWNLIFGFAAALHLGFLTISLAVVRGNQRPVSETRINLKKINDRGLYAMCRHPGVLFFILFYLSLSLALERSSLLLAGAVFSAWNIAYSLAQDRLILPRLLLHYDGYHERTPFLIPTAESLHRCIRTMRWTAKPWSNQ